jgi:hypothetical protein
MFMEKLTRGLRNNNPFNIRRSYIKFQGEINSTDPIFKQFKTRVYGIRAGLVILHSYYVCHNIDTVRGFITRFAPPIENQTNRYVSFVSRAMNINPDYHCAMTESFLAALGYRICQFENGSACPISLSDFIDCIHTFKLL